MSERRAHTLAQVADRVGPVSLRTVYTWIKKHGLPVTRIADRPMVLDDDLEAFIAKYRAPEGDPPAAT
jgi:hypothetical protein